MRLNYHLTPSLTPSQHQSSNSDNSSQQLWKTKTDFHLWAKKKDKRTVTVMDD